MAPVFEAKNNIRMSQQQTIAQPVSTEGVGIHTGRTIQLRFLPAEPDTGIRFRRVDLNPPVDIPALVDYVVNVERNTTLGKGDARVATVEHLMAAVAGMGIDNLLVEVDGEEVPILDGSAAPFIQLLQQAGVVEQEAERAVFVVDRPYRYRNEQAALEIVPDDDYRLTVMIDYGSSLVGPQFAHIDRLGEFATQIAQARTFCFFHELEMLVDHNLIKGGDLNNAIVFVDRPVEQASVDKLVRIFGNQVETVPSYGTLNEQALRYDNEPARHKLLDVVGDLALVGVPLQGHVYAMRPGHQVNIEFARMLRAAYKDYKKRQAVPQYDPDRTPAFTSRDILRILPHKHPFLLVDKVTEVGEGYVVGIKNVTYNEPFFQGHFPDEPVMPGVLQVEALAQLGGILILGFEDDPSAYSTYFLRIEEARFKEKVVPGDTMIMQMSLTAPIRRGICQMKGTVHVGSRLVTEARMTAQVVKNKK